jgi:hypothetical protein
LPFTPIDNPKNLYRLKKIPAATCDWGKDFGGAGTVALKSVPNQSEVKRSAPSTKWKAKVEVGSEDTRSKHDMDMECTKKFPWVNVMVNCVCLTRGRSLCRSETSFTIGGANRQIRCPWGSPATANEQEKTPAMKTGVFKV